MFDNSLDSVGLALHFVLLAGRFLVSNIPNGAEPGSRSGGCELKIHESQQTLACRVPR